MKNIYALLSVLFLFTAANAQIINFPDPEFKAMLLQAGPNYAIAQNSSGTNIKIDTNNDFQIQVSEALAVYKLYVTYNSVTNISGISYFTNLNRLECNNKDVTAIDVSGLTNLKYLKCTGNTIQTSLNITGCTSLIEVYCTGDTMLTTLNASGFTHLTTLECSSCALTSLNVLGSSNLANFYCKNNQLTSLDVSNLQNLIWFDCSSNQLTSINLSGTNAGSLNCCNNQLTALDLSSFTTMSSFGCCYNNLTTLDLSHLTSLGTISCEYNQLTSIAFPHSTANMNIFCNNNQLTNLDFSFLNKIIYLDCSHNSLTNLDISGCYKLETPGQGDYPLDFSWNQTLTSLNIKNGIRTLFTGTVLPNLRYLCRDLVEDPNSFTSASVPSSCVINSYCSYTPGGLFYTIEGETRYDSNSNGCDDLDVRMPRLKFGISNGTVSGNLIADQSGNYMIPVIAGTHTITPVLENPSYFTVTPQSATVTFPAAVSPFLQNFCIAPNGTHNDLEVLLIPINGATPGFTSIYKVTYRNKGTHAQSGTVSLNYNDGVAHLTASNPAVSSQASALLTWDFSNLLPFETREIVFELHLNTPTDTPPLNGGSMLIYDITATGLTDETPADNTFRLRQNVTNSFDPNDKRCLEGTAISPAMVGKEVHYMIRFENTGTGNARNIVVSDVIDTTKFDITSLAAVSGSHPFVTKISDSNKVEFFFQGINLPFDDANNDGYLVFKIKTKPTLVVGNSFSNSANIYFDYNTPILTNTATTTVVALANPDFEFADYFKVYPNPVNDILNLEIKKNIIVTSINIYNTLGQLILTIPSAQQTKTVDVSRLESGHYFLKVNTDQGNSNTKFIKN